METITRKINNREYKVVLTDELITMIDELQNCGSTPNAMLKDWTKLLGDVVRRLTSDYDARQAMEILRLISGINIVIDMLDKLGAPEQK